MKEALTKCYVVLLPKVITHDVHPSDHLRFFISGRDLCQFFLDFWLRPKASPMSPISLRSTGEAVFCRARHQRNQMKKKDATEKSWKVCVCV